MVAFQYTKGPSKKDGNGLFNRVRSNRTRGNGFKLKLCRFRLAKRKKCFTMRVVKHWDRLSREVRNVPSLEAGKASSLFPSATQACEAGRIGKKKTTELKKKKKLNTAA